jgi:hypothetical protein
MKLRSLMIAALVLVVLAGVLYWSGHHKSSTEAGASTVSPQILKLDPASITGLTVRRKGEQPVTLVKSGASQWEITEPRPLGADQTNVSGIVNTISSLDSERVVESGSADLKSFGLDSPSVEVDVLEIDHKSQHLLLGDATPTGDAIYAMVEGDPRVFTTYSYYKTSLDKGLTDLRDKRLIPVAPAQITELELARKGMDVTFGRDTNGWQIVKPSPLRADSSQVDQLVSSLTGPTMNLGAAGSARGHSENNLDSSFASAAPVATVTVTDSSGTQTLEVRKAKDTYYAKSSAVEGVYQTTTDLGEALDKSVDSFRNKKLFDFIYEEPNKIDLHSGTSSWSFTRNGDDWWSNGKRMDPDTIDALVSKLRDLTADSFVSSGFTAPDLSVTVTSNEGKHTETVQIAKAAHECIARRANEPSLYRLDAGALDDLTKAAAAIQPAKK